MLALAIDADAFNHLRSLGLLADLVALARGTDTKVKLTVTDYVATHELTDLQALVLQLKTEGVLQVPVLHKGMPAFELFRKLQRTYDKGESELGAWVKTTAPDTIIVSCDHRVPDLGKELKVQTWDLGQLVVRLIKSGLLDQSLVEARLKPWDNPHTGQGRPKWWNSLPEALA